MKDQAKRVLELGSMLWFLDGHNVTHVGIVARRNMSEMCSSPDHLVVGVSLLGDIDSTTAFLSRVPKSQERSGTPLPFATSMFQVRVE